MLEEALPLAIGVGAALLPAMAFGGLAAARAFMYLGAGVVMLRWVCCFCVCVWAGWCRVWASLFTHSCGVASSGSAWWARLVRCSAWQQQQQYSSGTCPRLLFLGD